MSTPMDPLQALQAALGVTANSQQQAELLGALRESLEAHPAPIPILVSTFISVAVSQDDTLFKRWIIELLHYALCRSNLSIEAKTELSGQTLDGLAHLVNDKNTDTIKLAIQCFTTVYPLLFRQLYTRRQNPLAWNTILHVKARIIECAFNDTVALGVRLAAIKFVQRALVLQSRGVADPRLVNRNDPNISLCPADHPFIQVANLETEGHKLLESVLTMLYSSTNPNILTALVNSWIMLAKQRPTMLQVIVPALCQWSPQKLTGVPASAILSVERSVRIFLNHIARIPANGQYAQQINEALSVQAVRVNKLASEEKKRKAMGLDHRKRSTPVTEPSSDVKRPKPEQDPNQASFLATFDFTTLPLHLISELIVANLEAFSESELVGRAELYRQQSGAGRITTTTPLVPPPVSTTPVSNMVRSTPASAEDPSQIATTSTQPIVKEEAVDPLQMDIDEEEMEFEPEKLNIELSGRMPILEEEEPVLASVPADLSLLDFKIPPPKDLAEEARMTLLKNTATRIWEDVGDDQPGIVNTEQAADMWMLVLVRMVTRVAVPPSPEEAEPTTNLYGRQDQLRQTMCDYIMANFPQRIWLATTWMNEEWYNDRVRSQKDRNWQPNYDTWLNQIVATYETHVDNKDKTFARFLLDLPAVPQDVLVMLREMCLDRDKMSVGFNTLRGFVSQRPSLRAEALNVLLELTTHPDKRTRTPAINAVKQYVPNMQPVDGMVREFALQMLRKLQNPTKKLSDGDTEMDGDDDQSAQEDMVQTPYLPNRIELPAKKDQVLQHVELLFALSVKVPEFLDEIFEAYGQMDNSVQEAIQQLITALVKSLGSNHGKLLTLMRNCPAGAESLALRVLTIFTEYGRPSAQVVSLVKGLFNERDLDARFLIPIIAEMDKADIVRYLPRIVSTLNGQPDPKNLVRQVFGSVVTTPPQTFATVTSNVPRLRQSELLSPAELMVLLHNSEKEIGLKSVIEAIGICFSMTDVFRSEILAVVIQQIMDGPTLPVLFLRTVIQAVTTYKSLVPYVSTTLLSRLITKKIWTNPPLWEGFIRCAKVIAPASFGALLQLPKDQLRELVDKQPSLKSGLRDFVMKKGVNKARAAGFLDIFGEAPPTSLPTEPDTGNEGSPA